MSAAEVKKTVGTATIIRPVVPASGPLGLSAVGGSLVHGLDTLSTAFHVPLEKAH